MCSKPPTPPKPIDPAPVKAPEVALGDERTKNNERLRKRRGRNQLRTGLVIGETGGGAGLTIGQ